MYSAALNLKTTPDALQYMLHDKNIALYKQHGVFSKLELQSRYEIGLENYCKLCNIEVVTMYKLVKKSILYAATAFAGELSEAATAKNTFLPDADRTYERDTVKRVSELSGRTHKVVTVLFDRLCDAEDKNDILEKALYYKNTVLPKMGELRELVDELELLVSRKHWPFPTYGDLLFSVR